MRNWSRCAGMSRDLARCSSLLFLLVLCACPGSQTGTVPDVTEPTLTRSVSAVPTATPTVQATGAAMPAATQPMAPSATATLAPTLPVEPTVTVPPDPTRPVEPTPSATSAPSQSVEPTAAAIWEPTPSPKPEGIPLDPVLPAPVYSLSPSKQITRLEPDGMTLTPITSEADGVNGFDVSPANGSLVYVTGNRLIRTDAYGGDATVLMDAPAQANDWVYTEGYPALHR
mgnify:CR=1 FL=1